MSPTIQLHLSILLAAASISYLTWKGDWITAALIFAGCAGSSEIFVMYFLRRRVKTLKREGQEFESSVSSIGLAEARARALLALSKGMDCVTEARSESDVFPEHMPPTLAEVFGPYRRVRFSEGDRLELGAREGGFVGVGRTFDAAQLFVRETDEALFEWDGPGVPSRGATPDYPSLLHWIAHIVRDRRAV